MYSMHNLLMYQVTWEEAKEDCELLYRGNGSLLSLLSEREFKDHTMTFGRHGEGNSSKIIPDFHCPVLVWMRILKIVQQMISIQGQLANFFTITATAYTQ